MCRNYDYDSATQTQGQGHVISPSICVRSISPKPFGQVLLNCIPMFLIVRQCAEHMTQPHRLKVKGFMLVFGVCPYLRNPAVSFS